MATPYDLGEEIDIAASARGMTSSSQPAGNTGRTLMFVTWPPSPCARHSIAEGRGHAIRPRTAPTHRAPGVAPELVQEGFVFTEGPVGMADGNFFRQILVRQVAWR